MTSISKNVFIDKLDDIVKKCNNKYKKYLLLRKLKMLYHGHMFLMTLMVKKLLVTFMKMNCKELIKKNSEQKKYFGDKLYVK